MLTLNRVGNRLVKQLFEELMKVTSIRRVYKFDGGIPRNAFYFKLELKRRIEGGDDVTHIAIALILSESGPIIYEVVLFSGKEIKHVEAMGYGVKDHLRFTSFDDLVKEMLRVSSFI